MTPVHYLCTSSKLAVFAYFGRSRGHTVLGFRADFQGLVTAGTRFERVVKTRRFRTFWPFSWTFAHNLRVPDRFPRFVIPVHD